MGELTPPPYNNFEGKMAYLPRKVLTGGGTTDRIGSQGVALDLIKLIVYVDGSNDAIVQITDDDGPVTPTSGVRMSKLGAQVVYDFNMPLVGPVDITLTGTNAEATVIYKEWTRLST